MKSERCPSYCGITCDCEFRKECRDEDTVLTCFVKCYIREKKLKQKAEQDHQSRKVVSRKVLKQIKTEAAMEIFDEIDNIIYNLRDSPFYSSSDAVYELTELKKKYTGEKEDAEIH